MKIFLAFLILLSASGFSSAQGYTCTPLQDDETTRFGGNEQITIIKRKSYRQLRGIISDVNGEPVENTLVEVFTNPEHLLPNKNNTESDFPEQKRIAACRTGTSGKFSFTNLPAGKYELRLSKDAGWNVTQIYVTVKPNSKKKREFELILTVGT